MASSVATMGFVGAVVPMRNAAGLSSSSSFGSHLVSAAPLRPVARRNAVVTRAALQEEQSGKTARREMLVSLMAAGAALATAGQSFAASGPGTGAETTNEKAGNLLGDADKLTTEDSPPRFGPGRVPSDDDTSRIAQKGGAGAIEELQGAGGGAIDSAKKTADEARARFEQVLGKKTGDLSDASSAFKDAAEKVSSDVGAAKGKASSDVSGITGKGGSLGSEAKSKVESTTKDGKDIIGSITDQIKGVLPQ